MVDWVYLTMSLLALVAVTAWGWWRECRRRVDAEEAAHRRLAACNEYSIEANELRGERQEWLREKAALSEELKLTLASRDRVKTEVGTLKADLEATCAVANQERRMRKAAEAERDRLAAAAQGWPRKEVALTEELLATISARDHQRRAREAAEAELARRDRTLDAVARALCRPGAEADGACAGKGGEVPEPELHLHDIKVGQTWSCEGPKPTPAPPPAPALVAVPLWRNVGGAGCWRPA